MIFKKSKKRKNSIKRRVPKPKKNSRFLELAMCDLALVIIYGASFAIRITHGFSRTIDMPEYGVRLQILNGCGINGAAAKMAKVLPGVVGQPLELSIIDMDDFSSYHIEKSFLISRDEDTKATRILAEQIGLEDIEILYEPLENNYKSITSTLVLGEDFEIIIEQLTKQED